MGFLDGIEKLINEHGSASILRERIALLNDQHAALLVQAFDLTQEVTHLKEKNEILELDKSNLQKQIRNLEKILHDNNPQTMVCDHCGSRVLKRTGSRPAQAFGALGIKDAIYTCETCGKESAFMQK